jgi:site-specific recombinase XerD
MLTDYVNKRFERNLFEISSDEMNLKEYRCYHAYQSLNFFNDFGLIPGTSMSGSSVRQRLSNTSENALKMYMDHLNQLEYSSSSKKYAYNTIHTLLISCPIDHMDDAGVLGYLRRMGSKAKSTAKSEQKVIKRFLTFAYDKKLTAQNFNHLILTSKNHKNKEIPSVYSPKEVMVLLNYLRNHRENRLRNFTIALLIAVYGIRAGDIANLKLADIDWDNGTLIIIQDKTVVRLEHKLTEFCGCALADYLLTERPDTGNKHVFLKNNGERLSATSVSTMVFIGFLNSGIKIGGRKHGSHSLRHSLACNMLEQGVNILDISHVLGHESVETTQNCYTKVDITHLRMCELEVPDNE